MISEEKNLVKIYEKHLKAGNLLPISEQKWLIKLVKRLDKLAMVTKGKL